MENLYKVGDVVTLSRDGLFGVVTKYTGGVLYGCEVCYPDGIHLAGWDWYYADTEEIPKVWRNQSITGYATNADRERVCRDFRSSYEEYYNIYNRVWYEKNKEELEAHREERFGGALARWRELGW